MARAELAAVARDTLTALLALVPRAVWRGVKGGFGGFLLGGGLGLAASGASALWLPLPGWLVAVQLGWVPLVLSLGGAYLGFVHGLLSAVTEALERQGLSVRLYGIVKPACVAAARRLSSPEPGRGGAAPVGAALESELEARLGEGGETPAPSFGARIERMLALRSRRVLCLSAVRAIAAVKDPESARAALRTLAVKQLEAWMVETVEDLFGTQLLLVAAFTLVAAALPGLLYALGLSLGV